MSFGISVGDVILCAQITHRLFVYMTDGRKKAPQDLNELQNALFGLWCALSVLEREHRAVMARAPSINVENLGYIITSCRDTLQEIEKTTTQYRIIIDTPKNTRGYFWDRFKVQWNKILWSFRGESFMKYRLKLQTYTDSLNLLLNTLLWSATRRIEQSGEIRDNKLDDLLQRIARFDKQLEQPSILCTVDYKGDCGCGICSNIGTISDTTHSRMCWPPTRGQALLEDV